jgi:drug/metabolite transporter (DMT)-like permease
MQNLSPIRARTAAPPALPGPASAFSGALRGIGAMVAAQLAFLLNDTLIKVTSETVPMGEIIFLRGAMAVLFVGLVVVALGQHRAIMSLLHRLVGWRIFGELGGTFFYLSALFQMPIANATIIFQAVPLTVTAGAALFLAEAVGWRRWTAIVLGFIGVVIVVRPGLSGFDSAAILVLISVLFVSMRDLTTRSMPKVVPTLLVTLATAIAISVMGAIYGLTESWVMPTANDFLRLAGAAVLLATGYATSILAMRLGEMSLTASFRYVAVVFAIALGYLVWGDVPDLPTLVGTVVIVAAGLYTLYREHQVARAGQPLVTAPAAIDPPTGG